ncbi:MAG: flagellar accessory protein FlaH [Anaerolineae bacterium]|nr:flagellar accessory protein FlaH [Anaerolineae bacterium]
MSTVSTKQVHHAQATILAHNLELDSKMGGGLPVGSLTLIEGANGSGKSVLSQQILWGALCDGFSAALFTSENSVSSMASQMQKIDLDILDYLLLGKFRVFPMTLSHAGEQATTSLANALKSQKQRDLIVIDSLTQAVINTEDHSKIVRFFERCKELCAEGITIIVTLHSEPVSHNLVNTLRSMCDANLKLRVEEDGNRMVKTLEVSKVRGASSTTGAIVGFEVEPGWGMRVIPISKARG